jgi:hypothetical protein
MRRPHVLMLVPVMLAAAATAVAAAGSVTAATAWSRISGPAQPGAQLGLARTADGVLHVIWNRGATNTSIFETRLSPAGRKLGTSTVATGWAENNGLALLVSPDKSLQLFAAGTNGIHTFSAPPAGKSWTQQAVAPWGGPLAESAYAIGAALTKDGRPVTAWRGVAAEGLPPASIPQNAFMGGMTESFLATDAGTGAVVLSGETVSGQGGAYVQQILPGPGPRLLTPPLAKDWSVSTSSRIGAAGVFVANADGRSVHLSRYGGGARRLATGPYFSAAVCGGPDGRLWVAWGDANGVFVTRTNRAAGALEPVQRLRPPSSNGLTFVQCEGSAGPADVFADDGTGFWQTHVLARFAVRAAATRGKVTISVRDAGDPVAGATVTIAGRHLRTGANGSVAVTLHHGRYAATVSAPGYVTASAAVRI